MANSLHFSDKELACRHCGVNGCTQELVDALEAIRSVIGLPINVNSGYRCPEHNAAVGGVPDSQHVQGIAADISVAGLSAVDLYRAALQVPAFANGGIGVARIQNYIHVDTRAGKSRWCYGEDGKQCPWDPALDAPVLVS